MTISLYPSPLRSFSSFLTALVPDEERKKISLFPRVVSVHAKYTSPFSLTPMTGCVESPEVLEIFSGLEKLIPQLLLLAKYISFWVSDCSSHAILIYRGLSKAICGCDDNSSAELEILSGEEKVLPSFIN